MAGRIKIVMIDDEADLCDLVKSNLEETGRFIVVTTTRPQETLPICLREKPDLILLDIVMPDIKGPELTKQLKDHKETAHIPIIVISGLGEMVYSKKKDKWLWLPNRTIVLTRGKIIKEKDPERAAQAYGVEGYLTKPFTTETLLDVIEEVLTKTNQGNM